MTDYLTDNIEDEYLEIDEDRISKIIKSLENKYTLQNYTGEYYEKVAFPRKQLT